MRLKTSALIAGLTSILEGYGDLPVTLTLVVSQDEIISSEDIYVAVDQREEGKFELNLRDFPY